MEPGDAKVFLFLSVVGHYSLFPLLFTQELTLIKLLLLILYSMFAFSTLPNLYPFQFCKFTMPMLNIFESVYLMGLCLPFIYEIFFHSFLGLNINFPFLPLMITSVYCAVGVLYAWIKYNIYFIFNC